MLIYLPNTFIPDEPFHHMHDYGSHPPIKPHESFLFFDTQLLISYLLMLSFALLIKMNRNLSRIRTEKLNAEVSYLKAQINPHFLFNTLNSLYALTLEKSNEAPNAVLKLSNIMRYVVTESAVNFVALEKEINHINDYIDLQKLRIDGETNLFVTIEGNPSGKVIAPLILIPFIENAFKYGINPDENSFIEIKIKIEADNFILNVKNSIVNTIIADELKTEKGLENTTKRLSYIYPDRHTLTILEKNTVFEVNLKIHL
jgi:LytS/YehU family sensor histidine kinase